MHWPEIPTAYIKCNEKLAGPIILITGFIISLWANCIVVGACVFRYMDGVEALIVTIAFLSHVIISLSGIASLIYGLKKRDPVFLKPWLFTKAAEALALFVGSIVIATSYHSDVIGLSPVGVILLMICGYIFLCVWQTYKKMKENPVPPTDIESYPGLEKPPSYDQFANQTPNI